MVAETALPLTVTNIVLALLVVGAVLYVFSEPLLELLSRLRKRRRFEAEVDRDMEEMFPPPGDSVADAIGRPRLFRRLAIVLRSRRRGRAGLR